MAHRNPLPETDRQICQRLRLFRKSVTGMTAVEFARRLDIDSNRLASYEHARVPLRYEFADRVCRAFNISQRWLAEGLQPIINYVPIFPPLSGRIPPRAIFSDAYREFLKPHVHGLYSKFPALFSGPASADDWELAREFWQTQFGAAGALDQINILNRSLAGLVSKMPPALYQQFFREVLLFCQEFQRRNSKRFQEWKPPERGAELPAWVSNISQNDLTSTSPKSKEGGVKSEIQKLIERVKGKASRPGAKSELARALGVAPARVSEWLSGEKEPGGEYTLKLLHWVESPER